MQVYRLPLGALNTNCYVLIGDDGAAAVVDPGEYAPELLSLLQEKSAAVEKILLTHGHADHISGAAALRDLTGAEICIHALDDPFTDSRLCMANECGCVFAPFKADRLLQDGDTVSFGSETLRVLHTPGHTPGGVCYLHDADRVIFSGDTLFCLTAGRTDFPRGSHDDLMRSLARLIALPGDWKVYPGHERSTTLDAERKRNYFIRRLGK
ncbi:MAG: MBL fold metallo-hydrolase [Clostridia bacterium]|nr:MBL fold metallo-hydrolase [Clostridia bacterium]